MERRFGLTLVQESVASACQGVRSSRIAFALRRKDENRRLTTVQEIRRLPAQVDQVIVLSHSKPFVLKIWEGSDTSDQAAMTISRDGTASTLGAWDVDRESLSDHERRYAAVRNYIDVATQHNYPARLGARFSEQQPLVAAERLHPQRWVQKASPKIADVIRDSKRTSYRPITQARLPSTLTEAHRVVRACASLKRQIVTGSRHPQLAGSRNQPVGAAWNLRP